MIERLRMWWWRHVTADGVWYFLIAAGYTPDDIDAFLARAKSR